MSQTMNYEMQHFNPATVKIWKYHSANYDKLKLKQFSILDRLLKWGNSSSGHFCSHVIAAVSQDVPAQVFSYTAFYLNSIYIRERESIEYNRNLKRITTSSKIFYQYFFSSITRHFGQPHLNSSDHTWVVEKHCCKTRWYSFSKPFADEWALQIKKNNLCVCLDDTCLGILLYLHDIILLTESETDIQNSGKSDQNS